MAVKRIVLDFFYHEAQSGKSKRENRENNGHLVHKTFTPNKQKLKYNTNKKSKKKNGNRKIRHAFGLPSETTLFQV